MKPTLPQGFRVRRPTMDDVKPVHHVIELNDLAEYGGQQITLEDMQSLWTMPAFHLDSNAWVVEDAEGRVVAYADVEEQQHARLFTFVRVHPDYQGRGIGEYLYGLVEEWAEQQIPLAAPGARVALGTFAGPSETTRRLIESQGFREIRRSWRMEIDLEEEPPAPEWPEGITMRTFVPGQDEWATFKTVDTAFEDHFGHMPGNFEQWKHWMIEHPGFDPTLYFLAFDGEQMAGCSLCRYELGDGWVNTLAVLRPWRKRGLGMALLLHSFGEFYRRGKRKVGLGVDSQNLTGATRLYKRAGMHVAREHIAYEKELRAGIELSTQALPV
jgi:mycothiol synthase